MNENRTDSVGAEERSRSSEAELLAEILSRMNERDAASTQKPPAANAAPRTVNLVEMFYFFLSKLHYIALGMLLGAVLLGAYARYRVTPVYTATSKLYIMGSTGTSIMADLQIGSTLTMDYQEVFRTWEVHQMVNDALGTVANPEDTRILYITVRHPDSQMAADIANAYATAAKRFITQTMNTDEPSTFSIALVPGVSSGVGMTGYVIRGILLGTVLAGGILMLIFLLDTRPRSPEDVMRYANLPTLAVIPANPSMTGSKPRGRKARKQ